MAFPVAAAASSNGGGSFVQGLGNAVGSAAATGTTGGLLGQLFGGWNARRQWKYQKRAMELQQQFTLEQMQKQYEYQKSMFDYENEYNSPVNTFRRFADAGINPSAVLGSSGASMSATVPASSGPSGSSISPGIGVSPAGSVGIGNPLMSSQIRLNDANARAAESSANLSDEKAVTEQSVRNLLGASVDEKQQNAYFLEQKSIYQNLVNAKADDMLESQLANLKASTDNLIASANLTEEQIDLVRAQSVETFVNASLSVERIALTQAQTDAQRKLADLYKSEKGFISLRADDLEATIRSLKANQTLTTYQLDKSGKVVPMVWKLDGYGAKGLILQCEALRGFAVAARDGVNADWENTRQWIQSVDMSISAASEAAGLAASFVAKGVPAGKAAKGVKYTERYGPSGEFVGGSRSYVEPY